MKRFLPLLLALLLALSLAVPAFADDEIDSADSPDTSGPDFSEISPEPSDTTQNVPDFSDTDIPAQTPEEGVTNDAAAQTPEESAGGIPAIPAEDIPVQYLAPEEAAQADSPAAPALPAVSVYDLAPVPSDTDAPVSSEVSYSMTPVNFSPDFIDWDFQDGYFAVFLTDAYFASFAPDADRADVLLLLSSYDYSFTVNGGPANGLSLDSSVGSFSFPFVADGSYRIFNDDLGLSFEVEVSSTVVPGSSSGSSLVSTVKALFGSYTPKTYNVTTYLPDGTAVQSTEIVPGLAGLDYEWIAGAVLFALALYGLLRMIGGLLKQ